MKTEEELHETLSERLWDLTDVPREGLVLGWSSF
jgi:hypothetical protein